eukprot:760150-Pyramimonas_sp.AAC.1
MHLGLKEYFQIPLALVTLDNRPKPDLANIAWRPRPVCPGAQQARIFCTHLALEPGSRIHVDADPPCIIAPWGAVIVAGLAAAIQRAPWLQAGRARPRRRPITSGRRGH